MEEKYWIEAELNDDKVFDHQIGPLKIYLRKVANEIWVAHHHNVDDQKKKKAGIREKDLNWSRWALKGDVRRFRFIPVFPDRSVIIKPEYPFQIIPQAGAKVYTRIPVFVRLVLADRHDLIITEIPTVVMSGTWFGLFTEGEICYWVSTTARSVLDKAMFQPWLVVCPLHIVNKADYNLNFDKLCLRVDRLSLYMKDDELWADETLISYQGGELLSDIEMKGRLPAEAKGGRLLTRPRSPIKKSFAVRTFKMFMEKVGI